MSIPVGVTVIGFTSFLINEPPKLFHVTLNTSKLIVGVNTTDDPLQIESSAAAIDNIGAGFTVILTVELL